MLVRVHNYVNKITYTFMRMSRLQISLDIPNDRFYDPFVQVNRGKLGRRIFLTCRLDGSLELL